MSELEFAVVIITTACSGVLLGALIVLIAVLIIGPRPKRMRTRPLAKAPDPSTKHARANVPPEAPAPAKELPRESATAVGRQGTGEATEYRIPPYLAGQVEISGEFRNTLERLLNEPTTFFVTGKAGTGKSTLLQLFVHNTSKRIALLAPTGLAAVNIRGETIHSFFKFPPRPLHPDDVKEIRDKDLFRALDALVIDEVSMVRADLMDTIDRFMRLNGRNRGLPYGGVQLILFGDVLQLPPVVASEEEAEYFSSVYDGAFFFHAKAFNNLELRTIELERVYRQADLEFIAVLDAIRTGQVSATQLEMINRRHLPSFRHAREDGYITLNTTNAGADRINEQRLNQIRHSGKVYLGQVEGRFRRGPLPTPLELRLKPEAQVMFVKNDSNRRWVNGTIGTVLDLSEGSVRVDIAGRRSRMIVDVGRDKWEILEHRIDRKSRRINTDIVGTYTQLPLKLAWAITIHKSQGLTFDKVIIDMGSGAFAPGQTYVALSRCRTLDGIILTQPVRLADVKVDPSVTNFLRLPHRPATKAVPDLATSGAPPQGRPISASAIQKAVKRRRTRKPAPTGTSADYGPRKCPHGVPFYYICAICEPERFREMTGIG